MKTGMMLMRVSVPSALEEPEPIMASEEQIQITDVASAMAINQILPQNTAPCVYD